jgi:hypothetical protein
MLMSLPICAAKVVIDILFAAASNRLPVRYQRDIQELLWLNVRAPGMVPSVVAIVTRMACIAVAKAWSTMSLA